MYYVIDHISNQAVRRRVIVLINAFVQKLRIFRMLQREVAGLAGGDRV